MDITANAQFTPAKSLETLFTKTTDRAERRRLRAAVVAEYRPRVVSIARRRFNPQLREEAEQAGCIGIIVALEKFDPAMGVPFWAFARQWVQHELQAWLDSVMWRKRSNRGRSATRTAAREEAARLYALPPSSLDAIQVASGERTPEERTVDAQALARLRVFMSTLSREDAHLLTCERKERATGGPAVADNYRSRRYRALIKRASAFVHAVPKTMAS